MVPLCADNIFKEMYGNVFLRQILWPRKFCVIRCPTIR